jgi:hypothetical protein
MYIVHSVTVNINTNLKDWYLAFFRVDGVKPSLKNKKGMSYPIKKGEDEFKEKTERTQIVKS